MIARAWLKAIAPADREGGQQRSRCSEPGKLPSRHAGAVGLKLPQRAVERVARTARRQLHAKLRARDTAFDRRAHRFERRQHADRLIVEIVDASRFATSAQIAIAQIHRNDPAGTVRVVLGEKRLLDESPPRGQH